MIGLFGWVWLGMTLHQAIETSRFSMKFIVYEKSIDDVNEILVTRQLRDEIDSQTQFFQLTNKNSIWDLKLSCQGFHLISLLLDLQDDFV